MKQEEEYLELRGKTVIKANELIQKSRFNLSLQQQKIVLYLISQITPYDEELKLYEFSIPEFCKVCGIDYDSGKNYKDLKNAIKEIADKSVWIDIAENEETLMRWIEKPYIDKQCGTIKIKLDEDMKPYLLQLKENFTKYELIWTLHFRSKYTIRLYELVKSIHFHELRQYERIYTLAELRQLLDATIYADWQSFKRRVLTPAVEEINKYSDKNISYEVIKRGKPVVKIQFTISSKNSLEALKIRGTVEKEMGLDQLTLWDELSSYEMV